MESHLALYHWKQKCERTSHRFAWSEYRQGEGLCRFGSSASRVLNVMPRLRMEDEVMNRSELESLIQNCVECKRDEIISDYILPDKPNSFYGLNNPKVMILDHSPTVRTSEKVSIVLKMDKPQQPLYQYINKNILEPLGICDSDLYCTNIIKCRTNALPEDILSSIHFFDRVFMFSRRLLEKEIATIKPNLIISLSEPVLKVISKTYMNKELKTKESFGRIFSLKILGLSIRYIPVVHIPKGYNSLVAKHYFPEQTNRLITIRESRILC